MAEQKKQQEQQEQQEQLKRGGRYKIKDGQRVRVDGTEPAARRATEAERGATQAKVGVLSPDKKGSK